MCTWAPTERVKATFRTVFPHVLEAEGGVILIGSEYPLQMDLGAWLARLEASASYLGERRAQLTAQRLRSLTPATAPIEVLPNRDLFPRDEFASAR